MGKQTASIIHILALLPLRAVGRRDGTAHIRVSRPLQRPSLSEILDLSLINGDWKNAFGQDHAALLIQRDAVKSTRQAVELLAHYRKRDVRLIYEIDDDLLHLPGDHPGSAAYSSDVKAAIQTIAEQAHAVVVSTSALKERMAGFNQNVFVLPNALDEHLWPGPPVTKHKFEKGGPVRILYMGTRTHDGDLALITDAIRKVKEKYGERVEFTCIGGFSKQPFAALRVKNPPAWTDTYPAFARWMARSCRYDMAVAPLVDDSFNRCKSYLKYLDYGICGFAPVLSDVQPYREVVRPDETGILVTNTPEHWYEALCALIEDPARRKTLARNAQEDVLAHHTLAAQAEERKRIWSEILFGL